MAALAALFASPALSFPSCSCHFRPTVARAGPRHPQPGARHPQPGPRRVARRFDEVEGVSKKRRGVGAGGGGGSQASSSSTTTRNDKGLSVVFKEPQVADFEDLEEDKFLNAVVKVYCTHIRPDYGLPWQKQRQHSSTGSAFMIGDGKLLTNVYCIEHDTQAGAHPHRLPLSHSPLLMALAASRAAASPRALLTRSRAGHLRAALPADGRGDGAANYKELGLYSWKKRIEDAVIWVEMTAFDALECEEAQRIKQEEALQSRNLWDNPAKSHETLSALSDAIRVVDRLKDLLYKAEEAKLISQLAGMDAIKSELFKQAYEASVEATEFLDHYQMHKLLKGPYDKEGACIIVTAGSEGVASELWAEKLFSMYAIWAQKQGCKKGLVEKNASTSGHIRYAAMEIESEYMFGTLLGEKGMHRMICSSTDNSGTSEVLSASVDIIPIFLDRPVYLHLDDWELEISPSPSECKNLDRRYGASVRVQHIPSGVTAESSGERSYFANKLKAMSRLKAKLLVISRELGVTDAKMIEKQAVEDKCNHETRKYTFGPQELVHDLNTGIQLSDLNSILEGDIEPFIRGRIISRHG